MKGSSKFINGFKKGMREFGNNAIMIINSCLLALVYIIGVGISSILAKIFRKKFLDIKIEKDRKSYWTDIETKNNKMEEHYRQF